MGAKKLTEKEERFCLKYFETGNGTRSVLDAGYKQSEMAAATTASRLLKKANIQARLNELRKKQEKRTEITTDYVLSNLKEVLERCMQRAPVMVREGREMVQLKDEEGRDVWRFDSNGANQALNMLGKYKKLFTEKHEVSGRDGGPIEYKNLSELADEELDAKISGLLKKGPE